MKTRPLNVDNLTTLLRRLTRPSQNANSDDVLLQIARAAIKPESTQNYLVSPFSVASCLSMLANAAKGRTLETIARVLGIDTSDLDAWNKLQKARLRALREDATARLTVANSFWTFDRHAPSPDYTKVVRSFYEADADHVDRHEDAAIAINAWVTDRTQGRITEIIDKVSTASTFALVNAIDFDGDWMIEFEPRNTRLAEFHTDGLNTDLVPTMNQSNEEAAGWEFRNGLRACSLPYRDGAYQLLLLLPPRGVSVYRFLSNLTSGDLKVIRRSLQKNKISISLPKLTFSQTIDLQTVLSNMGAGTIFEAGNDFTRAIPSASDQFIARAVQRARIEWDEKGTRATAVTCMLAAACVGPIYHFHADRPFLYLLVHNPTDTLLFVGICNDPSKIA